MYPFANQILTFRSTDPERRASRLVLEVKGDFCHKVRNTLSSHGREGDYVEVALHSKFRYNPLHNDLEAYALAYGIASLLNNLFGRGKEPFWQQAYTNLVKFIILLHKVNYDYVTLFDVYECAINPDKLEMRIREGERLFQTGNTSWLPSPIISPAASWPGIRLKRIHERNEGSDLGRTTEFPRYQPHSLFFGDRDRRRWRPGRRLQTAAA